MDTEIKEVSPEMFQKELSTRELKIKEAETKYLKRLVSEAKEAGVNIQESELLEIGEKGILKLIEQAKSFKKEAKEEVKVEVKETRGQTQVEEASDFCPEYAKGPIKVQGNEMFREWNYAWFKESYIRLLTGKAKAEDFY